MVLNDFINNFFVEYKQSIYSLMFYIIGVIVYSFIVWNFYTSLSKRDLVNFNLYRFDIETVGGKFYHLLSYFIKYILITPLLSVLWFIVMLALLFLLAKSQSISTLSIIVVTLIATTRVTAYYNEELSKELAKVIPFTLLTFFIIDPTIFDFSIVVERFREVPQIFPLLLRFFTIISVLEVVLRFLFGLKKLIVGDD